MFSMFLTKWFLSRYQSFKFCFFISVWLKRLYTGVYNPWPGNRYTIKYQSVSF